MPKGRIEAGHASSNCHYYNPYPLPSRDGEATPNGRIQVSRTSAGSHTSRGSSRTQPVLSSGDPTAEPPLLGPYPPHVESVFPPAYHPRNWTAHSPPYADAAASSASMSQPPPALSSMVNPAPYPWLTDDRALPDGQIQGSRTAPDTQISQYRQPSSIRLSEGMPLQTSSGGLITMAGHGPPMHNTQASIPSAYLPQVEPAWTQSYLSQDWTTGSHLHHDGAESSRPSLQPPPPPSSMIAAPSLWPDDRAQWGKGQPIERGLYSTQHPSSSSLPLHVPLPAGPASSTALVYTIEEPSSTISLFHGAHDFQMKNVQFNTNTTIVNGLDNELWRFNGLPNHPDMSGVQAEYLPDSRKPDVEESLKWISSSNDLVLCIHGPAGVGKTTLIRHLSKVLRSAGWLGASVFLGAFPPDTSGPETIIKTLAHKLGNIHPRAIPKIVEAMNQCDGASLENQLEAYILKPLKSLDHPHPFVVIVDGIDEWRDHPPFIKALACLNSQSAVIKLVLTSRWDLLTSRLPGVETISMCSYPLRPVPQEVARAYFTHHLENVDWEYGRKPSDGQFDRLAELSGGLLVWGATVCSLLSHRFSHSSPHEILLGILADEQKVGSAERLVQLYTGAIIRLFPSVEDQKCLRSYLGATFVLQEALPVDDFCRLVGMTPRLVARIQSTLASVQTRLPPPGSERMVHPASTLFHKSFLDYIQATPAENAFAISAFDSHAALALACLNQIPSLPPLPPIQTSSSSLHGLQRYAVKFLPLHVSHGTHRSHDEWVKTPHCSVLNTIRIDALQRWATQFLNMLLPEAERVAMEEQDTTAILTKVGIRLSRDGGEHWVFEVACYEVAVRVGHGRYWAWRTLGWCYDRMGRRNGSPEMYEEAVLADRCALELLAASDPERPRVLSDLGSSLWSLYECNSDVYVLNEGISHLRDALALLPAPHPDRVTSLIRLGGALQALFEGTGDLSALNEGITHLRDVVALLPVSHPERSGSLNNLGLALYRLFHRNGDIKVLIEGILHHRDALALRPAPHPDRSLSLGNLGVSLLALFDRGGDVNALNEAILHLRAATALQPVPHPFRPSSLTSLGDALQKLYGCNGNLDALKESILHLRDALALLPGAHPQRPFALRDLGRALHAFYESNGDLDALHEGISHQRDALALWPVSHQERPVSLNHLAIALLSRHKRDGDIEPLDEAIRLRRELVDLHPLGHRYRAGHLQRLAALVETRFALTEDEADRDEFEALQEELDEYESGNGSERDDELGTEA